MLKVHALGVDPSAISAFYEGAFIRCSMLWVVSLSPFESLLYRVGAGCRARLVSLHTGRHPQPCCDQLASCTEGDFSGSGVPRPKSVTKHKVGAKILSARWSNDGQYLALGMCGRGVPYDSSPGNDGRGWSLFRF